MLRPSQAGLWGNQSASHAMCFTGVNIGEDGKPNRWKIENSWGSEGLNEGYYMASDSWFVAHALVLGHVAQVLDSVEPVEGLVGGGGVDEADIVVPHAVEVLVPEGEGGHAAFTVEVLILVHGRS